MDGLIVGWRTAGVPTTQFKDTAGRILYFYKKSIVLVFRLNSAAGSIPYSDWSGTLKELFTGSKKK